MMRGETCTFHAFKGSIMVPSAESIFGDIVSLEMELSTDDKGIIFRNVGGDYQLKGLNGTKAIKQ